jgi:nicotinamidase-related amidase
VYNYPADPVYIEFADIKSAIKKLDVRPQKQKNPKWERAVSTVVNANRIVRRMPVIATGIEETDSYSKTAVIFISCQNDFLDKAGKLYPKVEAVMEKLGTKENLRRVMEAASNMGALIIHAPVGIEVESKFTVVGLDENKLSSMPDVFTVGSWGAELYKDTCASHDDVILRGRSKNDLTTDSRLISALTNNQINRIFVCGLLTDVTVEQTVLALKKKFKAKMIVHPISDATASFTMEAQHITFKTVFSKCSEPVTTDQAIDLLQDSM